MCRPALPIESEQINLSQLLSIPNFLNRLDCYINVVDMVREVVVMIGGGMVVTMEMGTATEMGMIAGGEIEMGMGLMEEDGSNLKKPLPDRPLEQNVMPVGMI